MADQEALRRHVHLMGTLLGQAIRSQYGNEFFQKIEKIRVLSKSARNENNRTEHEELQQLLVNLQDHELLPVARAFSQFLHLANIAEQYHSSLDTTNQNGLLQNTLDYLFAKLPAYFTNEDIGKAVEKLQIELVFTAHPTEITRRTLIHKYTLMTECLAKISTTQTGENTEVRQRLEQLIWQAWHTNECRHMRPTPLDEVKWGLDTIEHSLWKAIPDFIRTLNDKLLAYTKYQLSPQFNPVSLASWIGGDRDGNPYVTADITYQALLLCRSAGANLYSKDLDALISELSMDQCSPELQQQAGTIEPYRYILSNLRTKLNRTKEVCELLLQGKTCEDKGIKSKNELLEPLKQCYDSLCACNLQIIANGLLLDMIHRVITFGPGLLKIDIRQESERHSLALTELTEYLNLGKYGLWSEDKKQTFLLQELANPRPLLPANWQPSVETQEVLNTCKLISQQSSDYFGNYIISMAQQPSDVLTVILLLKEYGCTWMPVVPLFETLDDLNHAHDSVQQLLALPWYRHHIDNKQMIMIGYSDSAKDAGQLAAAWSQYQAMESITKLCQQLGVNLTFFHGRGGTVGRGGLPAHAAILSQPPGSVDFRLRVTEQGEMIRFKYGFPQIAQQNLLLYASATLEASLLPPPNPENTWRKIMDDMSANALKEYRTIIREEHDFVDYFRALTPEREFGKLLIGSRPPKRRAIGGIETLRAIPWIFAWSQCRFMLPVWLGTGIALQKIVAENKLLILQDMMRKWPFFRTRIEMLEMVFLKTDLNIVRDYENVLVPKSLHSLGNILQKKLVDTIEVVLELNNYQPLMSSQPWEQQAIKLRNPYTDPLHMLQAELIRRIRTNDSQQANNVEHAMLITIAGIAAGIRNTG